MTYGAKNIKTPTLDALAHDGLVFERAISQVPLTWPSHAVIRTGMRRIVMSSLDGCHYCEYLIRRGMGLKVLRVSRDHPLDQSGWVWRRKFNDFYGQYRNFSL